MRLAPDTLHHLPPQVERFGYDRDAQALGIVHFGIGAFHRAHQAWYADRALAAGDEGWAISGVSLRSPDVAAQLNPQGGLYTLTERSGNAANSRVIGAVREVLFAPEQHEAVVARIADPACHIVSFTVTEKGYARAADGSLEFAAARQSFYPLLGEALARRRAAGLAGVTLLSCDNLAHNGAVLQRLMSEWIEAEAPALADWFEQHCTCPSTMIDRIVPRSGGEDLHDLEARIGLHDEGAVFTECFSQWVIEDRFAGRRPRWGQHGVQLVADVAPYETAKLRMLNGAHSLLAYCGLEAGYRFVHEAVADRRLRELATRLMIEEALPSIKPAPGQDLHAYADQLLTRFADPALRHRLDQIAMDGTQKIPQRWLDTAIDCVRTGRRCDAIVAGLAAWIRHIEQGTAVDDPHGETLVALAQGEGRAALVAHCFDGAGGRAPLWPGYTRLLPLLR